MTERGDCSNYFYGQLPAFFKVLGTGLQSQMFSALRSIFSKLGQWERTSACWHCPRPSPGGAASQLAISFGERLAETSIYHGPSWSCKRKKKKKKNEEPPSLPTTHPHHTPISSSKMGSWEKSSGDRELQSLANSEPVG